MNKWIDKIIHSRPTLPFSPQTKQESEGGCGVIGVACAEKIAGKHLLTPLRQMCNRGNGKGGGIAAAGLSAEAFGISKEVLKDHYLLAIAYLDTSVKWRVEQEFVFPLFEVAHSHTMPHAHPHPQAVLYFIRVKKQAMEAFRIKHALEEAPLEQVEDEIVYQNTYQLNRSYYAAAGEKKAFVLSHGKNLLVLKCVGFADEVIETYQLQELVAHIWIGHHRYPTKGKVWHPGGAHPFIGLHEALVHNGDFANYSALCEYLAQRQIYPLFQTDTEVSALLFDLLSRSYRYPLEYVMEAMAPTTERDFYHLPQEKQLIYELLQKTHLHASPDGPWFFILAQSDKGVFRLIGITDTSMLRPQVFATQHGTTPIGVIASEKQAIDALLEDLSASENHFWPRADYYWSCRGGSYTDGGAFSFTVDPENNRFECANKFGNPFAAPPTTPVSAWPVAVHSSFTLPQLPGDALFTWAKAQLNTWDYEKANAFLTALRQSASSFEEEERALFVFTQLLDQIYPLSHMRRSFWLAQVEHNMGQLITALQGKERERGVIDGRLFPTEGKHSLARHLVERYQAGEKKFIIGNCRGHRFIGSGLGPASYGVEIDLYGSSGDYLGSGIDGAQMRVHWNAQDQAAQIMKEGRLIIYGDVGQTFMYGAKGGISFVRGSAAGRALINAVGKSKLIINGTALDYLAESFMAGDPLKGGGFAIINRVAFNNEGELIDLTPPYPGGNLFSLASGGALYIRDPDKELGEDQLNGGEFAPLSQRDEDLIIPFLEENARLFEIPLSRLLEKRGEQLPFSQVYRKIVPARTHFLDPEEAWVAKL